MFGPLGAHYLPQCMCIRSHLFMHRSWFHMLWQMRYCSVASMDWVSQIFRSFGCRYGVSPFEYSLGESGGSLQLAALSGQIKWPPGPNPPYPDSLHQFVTWMLQPQLALRPNVEDVCIHVDKLLAKFPTGLNALWTLQNPLWSLTTIFHTLSLKELICITFHESGWDVMLTCTFMFSSTGVVK